MGDAEDGIGVDGLCDAGGAVRGRAIGRQDPVTGRHLPGIGVKGESTTLFGVWGEAIGFTDPVSGQHIPGVGVTGESAEGVGVRGRCASGVFDLFTPNFSRGVGVHGTGGPNGCGVAGVGGFGVVGVVAPGSSPPNNIAGLFLGDVVVFGTVYAANKAFRIDHPLDPQNRDLVHAAVECSEMKTMYDGIVTIDDSGEATVSLPEWFEALNKDFRYQLTAVGAPATSLHIAKEIDQNEFVIGGGTPGLKVSWQVTGVRQDAWAKANPVRVEQDKLVEGGIRDIYTDPSQWMQKVSAWIEEERARTEELTERLRLTPSRHRPAPETGESLS